MNRFNIVDALIIFTGAKIILHPLIKQFSQSRRSSTVELLRKPELKCVDLPDDVTRIILSKLDMVTLCRCNAALSLDAFLPQIVSLTTPLPCSLFTPDRSTFWYGKLVNKILWKVTPLIRRIFPWSLAGPLLLTTSAVYLLVNTPLLWNDVKFFRRLKGLKLLEVEIPSFPCVDSRDRPNLWFKWDAKVGVHGTVDHFVYVFGDTVDDSDGDEHRREVEQFVRALRISARHSLFHGSATMLGYEDDDSWKTGLILRTKDAEGNGGLEIGPRPCPQRCKARARIYWLPSTSMFKSDEDAVEVEDVMVMLLALLTDGDDDNDNDDGGLIRACVGDSDEEDGEANQTMTRTKELSRIVKRILADDNCRLSIDFN